MWIDCLPLLPPSLPAVVFLSSLWHFAVWHFHAKYELQNAFQTDRTQNESNGGGGGVESSRVFGLGRGGKWADRQLGKRGWDSHTLRVTLTRAGQVPCSCFPTLYLPYLPLPCTTQSQLYLYTVIYSHVCASLTVRVCICVCLRWQRALLYALRRIAHKTFLLLI